MAWVTTPASAPDTRVVAAARNSSVSSEPSTLHTTSTAACDVLPADSLHDNEERADSRNANSWLLRLDEVGSAAVRAFYNPGTGLQAKFDVYKDIKDLGKDRVCALHLEQGSVPPETFEHLLGEGLIDFPKLKATLLDIDWAGWMFIARSRKQGREKKVEENMTHNSKFLHDLFTE